MRERKKALRPLLSAIHCENWQNKHFPYHSDMHEVIDFFPREFHTKRNDTAIYCVWAYQSPTFDNFPYSMHHDF